MASLSFNFSGHVVNRFYSCVVVLWILCVTGGTTVKVMAETPPEGPKDLSYAQDGGILYESLKPGEGEDYPCPGNTVTVHYVGTLLNGNKFDSSRDRGSPFSFTLGVGRVIPSFDFGAATMRRKELARFTCASHYAYGERGYPPDIPPNATLIFEVELLSWTVESGSEAFNVVCSSPSTGYISVNDTATARGADGLFHNVSMTIPVYDDAMVSFRETAPQLTNVRLYKHERHQSSEKPRTYHETRTLLWSRIPDPGSDFTQILSAYRFSIEVDLDSCGNTSCFNLSFSFFPKGRAPERLHSGLWNCSVDEYSLFQQHLECNLKTECDNGQDENERCAHSSKDCQGLLALCDGCYKIVSNISDTIPDDDVNHKAEQYCMSVGGKPALPMCVSDWHSEVRTMIKVHPGRLALGLKLKLKNALSLSSCEDLLSSWKCRAFLWLAACLILIGNTLCICKSFTNRKANPTRFTMIVLNLNIADCLMAMYLLIVAAGDEMLRGRYIFKDEEWRSGKACKAAGFLSLLSCEVSILIIWLVTIDRFIVLRFPFSRFRLGKTSSSIACLSLWLVGCLLALLPLLPVTPWDIYSQSAICTPLPIPGMDYNGKAYSFSVLIVFNLILVLSVSTQQIVTFCSVRRRLSNNDPTIEAPDSVATRWSQDVVFARRMIGVVVIKLLCCFTISLWGILDAAMGSPLTEKATTVIAVFVLPLSSVFNPFFYLGMTLVERPRRSGQESSGGSSSNNNNPPVRLETHGEKIADA